MNIVTCLPRAKFLHSLINFMRGQKSSFAGSALAAIDEGISVEELSLTKDFRQRIRAGIHS